MQLLLVISSLQHNNKLPFLLAILQYSGHLNKHKISSLGILWAMLKVEAIIILIKGTNNIIKVVGKDRILVLVIKVTNGANNHNNSKEDGVKTKVGEAINNKINGETNHNKTNGVINHNNSNKINGETNHNKINKITEDGAKETGDLIDQILNIL
jgi:hypothetical protein